MKPGSTCLRKKAEHNYDAIQPTWVALLQHTKIAAYQGGHCGTKHSHQTLIYLRQVIGAGFSWKENGSLSGRRFQTWQSHAENFSTVDKSLGAECRGRCCCARAALKCTALCSCSDGCNNWWLHSKGQYWMSDLTMMTVNEFWIARKTGCVLTTLNVWWWKVKQVFRTQWLLA